NRDWSSDVCSYDLPGGSCLTTTGATRPARCAFSRGCLFCGCCFSSFLAGGSGQRILARSFIGCAGINEILVYGCIHLYCVAHDVFPVTMLNWVQTFVFSACTRGQHLIELELLR